MKRTHRHGRYPARVTGWLRFFLGALALAGMAVFFGSGYTPPGLCGEVVRHNQQADIDASPFFYGDVEDMLDLIEGAERLYQQAKK